MPWRKEGPVSIADGVTVNAGASQVLGDFPIGDAEVVGFRFEVTYDAAASAGCTINVYAGDGVDFDTEPLFTYALGFEAGATVKETHQEDVRGIPGFLRIEAVNNDGSVALTITCRAWRAGR